MYHPNMKVNHMFVLYIIVLLSPFLLHNFLRTQFTSISIINCHDYNQSCKWNVRAPESENGDYSYINIFK